MKILDKYYSKILEVNTLNEVDKPLLKSRLKKLMTEEASFRLSMYQFVMALEKDKKLGDEVMKDYKNTVTKFMKNIVGIVKRIK
jgi:chemotaxis methyl-accepting protein methylase|tara:strand:- start:2142 stop:2393 length:252 start_codon:yes stop_codon:yes gene_type:complete